MDYLDILDEQGNKTGQSKLHSLVHKHGDWHACAHVWLVNSKNQVLLQKRSSNLRVYPNLWANTASGHVKAGESPEEAILRELLEELGLEITKDDLKFGFTDKNQDIENNNQIDYIYFVKKDIPNLEILIFDKNEVSEIAWHDLDKFEQEKRSYDSKHVPKSKKYVDLLFQTLKSS